MATTAELALSDIVHVNSPSPTISEHHDTSLLPKRSTTPEADAQKMLQRIDEMGLSGEDPSNASSRERELVDMVAYPVTLAVLSVIDVSFSRSCA
jgi:hypothetical protein